MKKTRMTMIAVLMAMLLVGCSAQEQPTEVEVAIPEVTAPQITEVPTKLPSAVTEGTAPTTAAEEQQTASKTAVTEPQETKPAVKSEERTPTEPEKPATKPQATEPKETTPVETQPAEIKPQVTEPPVTEAPETEPTAPPTTEPPVTTPPVTEPEPTEPTPSETVPPKEPQPTEPPAEVIDTGALESYGRSYASSAYGYNGTSACHPGTGAGYFPAATKKITSMEEGYSIIRQAIDSQYKRDAAYGYTPYEELDGKIVRCPINVSVSSTGEPNVYSITVYYGGTA